MSPQTRNAVYILLGLSVRLVEGSMLSRLLKWQLYRPNHAQGHVLVRKVTYRDHVPVAEVQGRVSSGAIVAPNFAEGLTPLH